MPATRTLKRRPKFDMNGLRATVLGWVMRDDNIKALSLQKEEARQAILSTLTAHGTEDDKGSFWINWPEDPVGGRIKGIKAEKRTRKILDPEKAEEYLKRRRLYQQCTETIVQLDEGKILALNYTGTISDDDLEALYTVEESYAFVPQRVKL